MTPAGLLFDFNGTLFLDNALNDAAWNQLAQLLRDSPFRKKNSETSSGANPTPPPSGGS